jgi:hypothetical protein
VSPAGKNRRYSSRYRKWRKLVLDKCNSKCVKCGSYEKLHAHHIKSWQDHPEIRFDVANGEILCFKCHVEVHPFMAQYYDAEGNKLKRDKPKKFAIRPLSTKQRKTKKALKRIKQSQKKKDNYAKHRFSKNNPNPNWASRAVAIGTERMTVEMNIRIDLENT